MHAIPRDRIFLVQMADAPRLDMDYLSWSRHYRCFPGQGDFPIDGFMDALQATGFDGLISLEIFNDSFRAGSPRRVAVDGQRSLLVTIDELQTRTGVAVPGFPKLPPRGHCRGIDFIEFAMDDAAAASFEVARRARLRQDRHPQIQIRHAMAAGRHQLRRQPREGRVRPLLQHHPRLVGLRIDAPGR
jgi:hypothetical protein